MQLNVFIRLYTWWLTSLSELLTQRRSPTETWRTLLKTTPSGLEVHTRSGRGTRLVATLPPDADEHQAALLASIVRREASGKKDVLLRMPPSEVLVRTIQIPRQASDVIAPVVNNQIERMVPWSSSETRYGFRVAGPNAEHPDMIDVDVVATNKEILDRTLRRAQSLGLEPANVDFVPADDPSEAVELMSLQPHPARKTAAHLQFAFSVLLAGTLLTAGYGAYQLWSGETEAAEIEAQITAAQARVTEIGRLAEENDRLREQRGRLVKKKTDDPAMMILIEALSRALPDTAYLTELEIEGREVRMIGKSDNATALITRLEDTSQFADVRFSAPTTREPPDNLETFSIIARAENGSNAEMLP
jgi:general secretion pathway protein L